MLKRGRIDAIMDYPVRIDHLRQVQQDNTTYTALPLQGLPLYLEGFVVCNREAHGQQLMQYIDELMAQPQVQQRLVASYRQYFTDAQWQQLQPYLQQTFSAAF
jgi:spermidine/putrescine-binding protein